MKVIKLFTSIIVGFYFYNSLANVHSQELRPEIWKQTEHGVTFSLQQLSSENLDAFYYGRGFSLEQMQPYVQTCVYTAILRNDNAPGRIHFLRSNWDIVSDDQVNPIRKNSSWLQQLKQKNVKPSALIAFRLAQIPEEQEYESGGDWNRGMLSVGLTPKAEFDITIRWDIESKPYSLTMHGVKCI
jgi:hypothetical protein